MKTLKWNIRQEIKFWNYIIFSQVYTYNYPIIADRSIKLYKCLKCNDSHSMLLLSFHFITANCSIYVTFNKDISRASAVHVYAPKIQTVQTLLEVKTCGF